MIQDHRYLDPMVLDTPILDVQRRFRVKSQHPNSQSLPMPFLFHKRNNGIFVHHQESFSVQNCDLSPTTKVVGLKPNLNMQTTFVVGLRSQQPKDKKFVFWLL